MRIWLNAQKCKEEVDVLGYSSRVDTTQEFSVNESGTTNYGIMEDFGEHYNEEYICPECNHTICKTEEEAIKFLEDKK